MKTQHWKCCEVNSLRGFESHPFLHVGAKFALLRFSLQKNIRPLPCSSFFAKAHVHVGYSVASALITPLALYQPFARAPAALSVSKQSPSSTPKQSSLCSVFLCRKTSARFLAPPFSQKLTFASATRLQAPS